MKKQFATFYLKKELYGIDVIDVQEITKPLSLTPIFKAPNFIKGLINLRGQISTAVSLNEIINGSSKDDDKRMSIVCKNEEGFLVSLLVDEISDVMELDNSFFEPTPVTASSGVREIFSGVYKTNDSLITVVDIKKLFHKLENKE